MAELTRATIDAEHYVARYTQGRLSEAELEAFEEYCLLHPELVEQVQTDRILLSGLRSQPAARAPRVRRFNQPQWFALAASALIAVFGVAFWRSSTAPTAGSAFMYRTGDPLPEMLAQHVDGPRTVLRVRASEARPIPVDPNTAALRLVFEPANAAGASEYRVSLAEEIDGVWLERSQLEHLTPDPGNIQTVTVIVNLTKLSSPHLRITLSKAGGKPDDFYLRIGEPPHAP